MIYNFEDVADLWRELQDDSAVCDAMQTFEWAKVLCKSMSLNPKFLVITTNGQSIGGSLLIERNFLSPLMKYAEIRGGPLCISGNEDKVIMCLIRYLRGKRNYIFKVIQPSPLLSYKFVTSDLYISQPRTCTFHLDLGLSEHELWNSLDKKARWGTRKAERSGVKVIDAHTWTLWKSYFLLHKSHSLAHGFPSMPLSFFENAFKVLYPKGMAKLFLASVNGKLMAGSLFLVHRWYMVYFQNASVQEFLAFQPNNLIQWESIVWAKNNGIRVYDLGGVLDPSYGGSLVQGVYQYKKRWGGRLVSYDYFFLGRMYGYASSLFYKSELVRRVFSALRNVQAV